MLCLNNGTHGSCVCEIGYKLSADKKGCDDINECKEGVDGNPISLACPKDAQCVNTKGSYHCVCPRGQMEDHMHRCVSKLVGLGA